MTVKIKKRQVNPNRNTDRDYINGRQLYEAIVDWYDSGEEEVPRLIVDAITQIVHRLGTKYNFANYTYKDEMIGNGMEKCIMAIMGKKFDPKRTENPFAYFTQIAYNEFIRVITDEHKQVYIKHKQLEKHMIEASLQGEAVEAPETDGAGRIDALVDKFEKKKT